MEHSLRVPLRHPFLTRNDLELLRLLAKDFLLLTRQQINTLFPDRSLRNTNYRLRKLLIGGFVSRRLYPSVAWGPKIPLYYLGPKATEALGLAPSDPKMLARRKRALQLSDGGIPHHLLVDSVHIRFLVAPKTYPAYELLSWIPQYDALWTTLNDHGFPLRPDGYSEIRQTRVILRFFLELDRGTERGQAIRAKFDEYQQYLVSGRYEQHFSAPNFRVLFITSTERRAGLLARHASSFPGDLFWFSPADTFFRAPLLDPYWRIANSDVLQSLSTPL